MLMRSALLKTGRRPYDCVWQYQSKPTISWNPEKEKELLNAVSRYGENNWQLGKFANYARNFY